MSPTAPGKLVVVGTGLIGGSFALALKNAGKVGSVVGVGRGRDNLDQALRLGVVDRAYTRAEDWTAELADAALVLLATPVGEMPPLLAAIAPHLGPETIISDAGSTKQDVIVAARAALGAAFSRFVPAHPIAGSERSGAAAASVSLFRGRQVVLTPLPETDSAAVERVGEWWMQCGGIVTLLTPERHDALLSAVSHLPHLLAFALIGELADRPDAADYWRVAGTGLRDFTRLAESHPDMWRDICIANAVRLRADLSAYRQQLERIDAMLARADGAALGGLFARSARRERPCLPAGGGDDRLALRISAPSSFLTSLRSRACRDLAPAGIQEHFESRPAARRARAGDDRVDWIARCRRCHPARRSGRWACESNTTRRARPRSSRRCHAFPGAAREPLPRQRGHRLSPVTAALALSQGDYELSGAPRMHERPIGDLVDALRALGADIRYKAAAGFPPLTIAPGAVRAGGKVEIRGNVSSQCGDGAADGTAARERRDGCRGAG